jgi:hypothetical protein
MAWRTHFSKCYLSKVETGKRKATPTIIQAYLDVLGDDVNRRQLLMALLAGAATPLASVEMVGRAFELTLDAPTLTVDDWLDKLENYGQEYISSLSTSGIQMRLASDLVQLQTRLDHRVLAAVAAKLLTLHGLAVQSVSTPGANYADPSVLRWHSLAIRVADRSDDLDARVWTRGRTAGVLAYDGVHEPIAADLANEALALSDRPSTGRLLAHLAQAFMQSRAGDISGTTTALEDAWRTFEAVGDTNEVSDFTFPEWRMELMTSLLAARLGNERAAQRSQDALERTLPTAIPQLAVQLDLHRGLLMAKTGDRQGGLTHAQTSLATLPEVGHRSSLRILMREIEST